ncbi:MAG: hypothetical protein BWY88_01274 [Synergistetes bacterium ADurb.Bin520]|nr:MAG: hypothetical protein BWY88_01274 [Synergistetes bacterium ADurb.Bin520]
MAGPGKEHHPHRPLRRRRRDGPHFPGPGGGDEKEPALHHHRQQHRRRRQRHGDQRAAAAPRRRLRPPGLGDPHRGGHPPGPHRRGQPGGRHHGDELGPLHRSGEYQQALEDFSGGGERRQSQAPDHLPGQRRHGGRHRGGQHRHQPEFRERLQRHSLRRRRGPSGGHPGGALRCGDLLPVRGGGQPEHAPAAGGSL